MKTFYFLLVFLSFYFLFFNLDTNFAVVILGSPAKSGATPESQEDTDSGPNFAKATLGKQARMTGSAKLVLDKTAAAGLSLGISPPLIKITAQAPAQIKTPIIIQNLADESVELDIIFKPHIFDKIEILDENNPIQNLTLAPKQEKKLFLKIDIPENETNSEYYFSIQFISKPSIVNDNLNYSEILGGVATNVLLSIGKESAKGVIQKFSAPLFLEKSHVPFTLEIKNTGSHFITPQGVIVIKNMFGQIVGKIDLLAINILKDSTRSIKTFWNESFLLGAYRANLNISLSPQGPIFTRSISFFVIPTQTIIAILTSLFIVLLIYNRIKKR